MRLCGTTAIPQVYTEDYSFEIGKAICLQEGKKVALIATGVTMVAEAMKAAKQLEEKTGISPTIINMHTIKPIDSKCINSLAETHDLVVTIEEHNILGGLGSAVAEVLSGNSKKAVRQLMIGIPDQNCLMGSRQYMLKQVGLLADDICNKVIETIGVTGE